MATDGFSRRYVFSPLKPQRTLTMNKWYAGRDALEASPNARFALVQVDAAATNAFYVLRRDGERFYEERWRLGLRVPVPDAPLPVLYDDAEWAALLGREHSAPLIV